MTLRIVVKATPPFASPERTSLPAYHSSKEKEANPIPYKDPIPNPFTSPLRFPIRMLDWSAFKYDFEAAFSPTKACTILI